MLGCGAKLLGSFYTAEMGPSSGGAEFLGGSKQPGEWQMLWGLFTPYPSSAWLLNPRVL